MSSTDDRIVKMQFDNAAFKKEAANTQKALADVNKAVDSAGKGKGLLDLSSQMSAVAVTASKMQVVTVTALATIANKVVNTGLRMASALTFDPIRQGFAEYESLLTKQNVIMNATGLSAQKVKGYLRDLNTYSDETIYSFGDMTDSITKFVNAGVDMPTSVRSIKGIANAAAYAGASSGEAGRAMYAFSQSMQTGYIMLQDWMQIENANMGTMQFKEELLKAAVAAGTLTRQGDGYVTASGKFVSATEGWRDGLQEQWATTEVLNNALGKYADRTTALGKKAFQSATEVRTFTAFMDTLKESIGSGWSNIFTALIGNLKQATSFWTSFSEAVGGGVDMFFSFAESALKTWRKMGGFEKTLQGFANILAPIKALLGAIGDAWRAAFPDSGSGAGTALYGLSAGFEALTRPLAWLAKGIPVITPVLTLLFGAIRVGGTIIGNVIGFVWDFVKGMATVSDFKPSGGGFIDFLKEVGSAIGEAIDKINELLQKGGSLGASLGGVFAGLNVDLPGLPDFGGASEGASQAGAAAKRQVSGLTSVFSTLSSLAVKMGALFSSMWDKAKEFFSGWDLTDVVRAFNLAILSTMAISISRFLNTITKGFKGFAEVGPALVSTLEGAGGALQSFQTQAKAKLIINIGIALGILAASLWLLSTIPAKKLATALLGMGALVFMLNKAMGGFGDMIDKMDGKGTFGKTIGLSIAMTALAVSMVLLSTALLIMNKVDWTSLIKGLGTMTVMILLLERVGNLGGAAAKNLVGAAVAITATAVAMTIMAGALLLFQLVKWKSIGKAGAVLGGLTLAVGALGMIPYQGIAKVGLALVGASVGILLMANALLIFQLVKWESIGKAAVVLTMLTISLAVLMAVGGPVSVASMLGLAGAMVALAAACVIFNNVEWASIGKAAVVLTVLLAALAVGAVIMTAFLYAIAPVSPVLIILAAGFALLGVGLLAFAAAMSIAMTLAAAGTAAFAALATGAAVAIGVFLQTLALQAPVMRESILAILQEIINTIVQSVPMIIQGFKDLWKAIQKEMSSGDKKKSFGEIAGEWFDKIIEIARKYIPKLVQLGIDVTLSLLQGLAKKAGEFADAGMNFIIKVVDGIGRKMGDLTKAAVDMVLKLADGLAKNAVKLADAGIDLIAGFLHDLADAIRDGSSKIGNGIGDVVGAMTQVGVDMVTGLGQGIADNFDLVLDPLGNLVEDAIALAKKIPLISSPSRVFMDIGKFMVMGLAKGIRINAVSVIVEIGSMMRGAIAMADEYMNRYIQRLDQQAIKAQARASGLAAAAEKATKSAERTKDKKDDKEAKRLRKEAREAAKEARKESREARRARRAAQRKERWEKADAEERAEIRAKQAQNNLAAAKDAERSAEAARVQANALEEQAKKAGNKEERERLMKEVERLRKQARRDAERANRLIKKAKKNAESALIWQTQAGQEAAESFQEQFDKAARADAEAERFEKMTDEEKATYLRWHAEALRQKSEKNLAKAKELALTDIDRANKLAQLAMEQAEQYRQMLSEAEDYARQARDNVDGSGSGTRVVDLEQTDAAARTYELYAGIYDAAYAAASNPQPIVFEQNNYSPESLSNTEIYRQTNNQLSYASRKLAEAAA